MSENEIVLLFVLSTGGQLFVGLYTDYWENDAALYRLGTHGYTRTEVGDRQLLNGETNHIKHSSSNAPLLTQFIMPSQFFIYSHIHSNTYSLEEH